jgi:hypothetical protein
MLKPFMKLCISAVKTDERMLQSSDFGILKISRLEERTLFFLGEE